jgi:hypothetical protein
MPSLRDDEAVASPAASRSSSGRAVAATVSSAPTPAVASPAQSDGDVEMFDARSPSAASAPPELVGDILAHLDDEEVQEALAAADEPPSDAFETYVNALDGPTFDAGVSRMCSRADLERHESQQAKLMFQIRMKKCSADTFKSKLRLYGAPEPQDGDVCTSAFHKTSSQIASRPSESVAPSRGASSPSSAPPQFFSKSYVNGLAAHFFDPAFAMACNANTVRFEQMLRSLRRHHPDKNLSTLTLVAIFDTDNASIINDIPQETFDAQVDAMKRDIGLPVAPVSMYDKVQLKQQQKQFNVAACEAVVHESGATNFDVSVPVPYSIFSLLPHVAPEFLPAIIQGAPVAYPLSWSNADHARNVTRSPIEGRHLIQK